MLLALVGKELVSAALALAASAKVTLSLTFFAILAMSCTSVDLQFARIHLDEPAKVDPENLPPRQHRKGSKPLDYAQAMK